MTRELFYKIPDQKKMRVVIDTDAACECDDFFAVVHALYSPTLEVTGILAEQFGDRLPNTMEATYQALLEMSKLVDYPADSVYRGIPGTLENEHTPKHAEAVEFLIREARREDARPLFVLCQGALTNVASALLAAPDICERLLLVVIGGVNYPQGGFEFNTMNDIHAFNAVMNSKAPVWMIPEDVYSTMQVSLFELQERVAPCGAIGKFLMDKTWEVLQTMVPVVPRFPGMSDHDYVTGFPNAAAWALGDSAAPGVLLSHRSGEYRLVTAPRVSIDGSYQIPTDGKQVRWYTGLNQGFILEDFYAKLKYCTGV